MTETPTATQPQAEATRLALTFDAQEFCHFLADCEWTEEQKIEFIEALWQIVVSFVDLGFDLHPIQQVNKLFETLEPDSAPVLSSEEFQTAQNRLGAACHPETVAGRKDS